MPEYNLKERVNIKGTQYTGTVVGRKSFFKSFFGLLPRYNVRLDSQNIFIQDSRALNNNVIPYKAKDLEKMTNEELGDQ